ncbi:class I SAM-dependent methyltransferase [Nonomuraea recticatena]|uniref:class I SAM-dependent methyltransferase n=1 Tax=Nonomuraea recticatena TaxID=46178 RepID=UPI003612801C
MSALNVLADRAGRAAISGADTSGVAEAIGRLDRLALLGIATELHRRTRLRNGGTHAPDQLALDLGAAERHRWIVAHWLDALHEEGLAGRAADGRFHDLYGPRRAELTAARTGMESARIALGYPPDLATMLLRSLGMLPELLRDEIGVQALLYPDGEPGAAEAVYRDNLVSRYLNAAAAEVLRDLAEQAGRPLRILELGAGIGATTADLLPVLAGRPVEFYLFTDLSPFFLDTARRRFGTGFLRYALLDISTDLPRQPGELDLVVAATMAHNAPTWGACSNRPPRCSRRAGGCCSSRPSASIPSRSPRCRSPCPREKEPAHQNGTTGAPVPVPTCAARSGSAGWSGQGCASRSIFPATRTRWPRCPSACSSPSADKEFT